MKLDELPLGRLSDDANIDWEVFQEEGEKGTPAPLSTAHCVMCRKPFIVPLYTGVYDPVCGECFKTYMDTAKVVCAACGNVVGRVVPGVKDCGYEVKAREVLHTNKCSLCCPDIATSTILEIDMWMQYNREPVLYSPVGEPKVIVKKKINKKRGNINAS